MPGDILCGHTLAVDAIGIRSVDSRGAVKHPAMHRTMSLTFRNMSSGAKVEKMLYLLKCSVHWL